MVIMLELFETESSTVLATYDSLDEALRDIREEIRASHNAFPIVPWDNGSPKAVEDCLGRLSVARHSVQNAGSLGKRDKFGQGTNLHSDQQQVTSAARTKPGETGGKIGGYETRRARKRGETGQKK